jgi:hypothetical protein
MSVNRDFVQIKSKSFQSNYDIFKRFYLKTTKEHRKLNLNIFRVEITFTISPTIIKFMCDFFSLFFNEIFIVNLTKEEPVAMANLIVHQFLIFDVFIINPFFVLC